MSQSLLFQVYLLTTADVLYVRDKLAVAIPFISGLSSYVFEVCGILVTAKGRNPFYFRSIFLRNAVVKDGITEQVAIPFISGLSSYALPQKARRQ